MSTKYENRDALIQAMKMDLLDRTYVDLLTNVAVATETFIETELVKAAAKNNDSQKPVIEREIKKSPPPGMARLSLSFKVADDISEAGGEIKTHEQATAYKDAFSRVIDVKLGSKAAVLRLLASVGVT